MIKTKQIQTRQQVVGNCLFIAQDSQLYSLCGAVHQSNNTWRASKQIICLQPQHVVQDELFAITSAQFATAVYNANLKKVALFGGKTHHSYINSVYLLQQEQQQHMTCCEMGAHEITGTAPSARFGIFIV